MHARALIRKTTRLAVYCSIPFSASLFVAGLGDVQASAGLAGLGIQLSDLRPGYAVTDAGYLSALAVSRYNFTTVASLRQHRWLATYSVVYHRTGSLASVRSIIDAYSTTAEASWGFHSQLHGLCPGAFFTRFRLPAVGSESGACLGTGKSLGFKGHGATVLIFRQGPYVVSINAFATGHDPQSAVALARLVDSRIRLHALR